MNMSVDLQTFLALAARHALGLVAGWLAAHGYINSSATEQFISAAMFLGTIGWSVAQKDGVAWLKAEKARLEKLLAIYQKQATAQKPNP